jgi:hypothetical protein
MSEWQPGRPGKKFRTGWKENGSTEFAQWFDTNILPTSTLDVSLAFAILGFTFVLPWHTVRHHRLYGRSETRSTPFSGDEWDCRDHHGLGPGGTACDRYLLHNCLFRVHGRHLCSLWQLARPSYRTSHYALELTHKWGVSRQSL